MKLLILSTISFVVFLLYCRKNNNRSCKIISFHEDILTIKISSPKSFIQIVKKYGIGKDGFYNNSINEIINESIPESGVYEINFKKQLINLNEEEQCNKIPYGWKICHPVILACAILEYKREKGKILMDKWQSRTSLSRGNYSLVLNYSSSGLSWYYLSKSATSSFLGLVMSRKIS